MRDAIRSPDIALLWIVFIAVANFRNIPMLPGVDVTATLEPPVTVAAAVLLPLPFAVFVTLVGKFNEREFRRGTTSPWNIAFNRVQGALTAGSAAFAASLVAGSTSAPAAVVGTKSLPQLVLCTVVAAVVYNVVNTAAVTVGLALIGRLDLRKAAKSAAVPFPHFALDFGLVTGLGLLIVVLYKVKPWSLLSLALPLWLGYNALRSARESADHAEQLTARVRELETLNALSRQLLTARRREQVEVIGREALHTALDSSVVELSLEGRVSDNLRVVKVTEAAVIGVPQDTSERPMEVVDAAARLLGMALQRLELESELSDVQRAHATLASKIIEEATRERSRIALAIHDEVLPFLAAAEIQADNVRSAISGTDSARAAKLAAATREAVNGGVNRLREVLDALTHQIVVPGGLRQALMRALDQLRVEHGVQGRLKASEPLPELPLAVEILVFEVVRGCLGNIAKHAHARNVVVEVDVNDTLITVQVRDDGRGFDPASVPAGRHGLALMQQRVKLARGRFTVRSADSVGTRVEVEVPL
ncbi:MAG: sensor histidine kinase [Egibacteraceae bacterium]